VVELFAQAVLNAAQHFDHAFGQYLHHGLVGFNLDLPPVFGGQLLEDILLESADTVEKQSMHLCHIFTVALVHSVEGLFGLALALALGQILRENVWTHTGQLWKQFSRFSKHRSACQQHASPGLLQHECQTTKCFGLSVLHSVGFVTNHYFESFLQQFVSKLHSHFLTNDEEFSFIDFLSLRIVLFPVFVALRSFAFYNRKYKCVNVFFVS